MPTFIDVSQQDLRILLDLADNPRHVQANSDHRNFSVVVPDYLYERYTQYQSLESSPEPKRSGSKK